MGMGGVEEGPVGGGRGGGREKRKKERKKERKKDIMDLFTIPKCT